MKVKYIIALAGLAFLVSCGDSAAEKQAKLDAEIEAAKYKPAPATLDVNLFTGEKEKLWMIDTDSLPEGTKSSDFYLSYRLKKADNWIYLNYDYQNSNQMVQYYVSKDTMVFDFGGYPAVLMKYLVTDINDSVMVFNDLQKNVNGVRYLKTKQDPY